MSASEEKASKTDSSSYYFFKSTPVEEAKKYAPQKVRKEKDESKAASATAGSVWNSGGTWEERDVSKWACERVKQLLMECQFEKPNYRICKISKVKGNASIIFTRGKRKVGYELDVHMEWEAALDDICVKGIMRFPEVVDYEDEFEYLVECHDKEHSDSHEMAIRDMHDNVRHVKAAFAKFIEELQFQEF